MSPNETEKIKEWAKARKYTMDFFQPIHVSKILAKLAEQEKADMIMLGKVSIVLKTKAAHIQMSFSWQLMTIATRLHRWQPPFLTGPRYKSNYCTNLAFLIFVLAFQGVFASKVTKTDAGLEVLREIDGGLETINIPLPAVLSADLRLNEPRYTTLPNITKAKKKKVAKMTPKDLGVDTAPRIQV